MTRDELARAIRACEGQVCNPWVVAEAVVWWAERWERRHERLRRLERERTSDAA